MIITKAKVLALSAMITLAFFKPSLSQGEKSAIQAKANLPKIKKAVICEKIEARAPWGSRQVYPSTIGNLYCFTQLTEIPSEGTIYHIWYHGKKEMAKVELSVLPPQWRTYSSKIILPSWKGSWRVEIVYGDYVLKTLAFAIQ